MEIDAVPVRGAERELEVRHHQALDWGCAGTKKTPPSGSPGLLDTQLGDHPHCSRQGDVLLLLGIAM